MSKKIIYQPSWFKQKTVNSLNWYKSFMEIQKSTALLKAVGVEYFDAVSILKLLQNEERLKIVVKKLKLKAFL